jgi:hypothetical protein
MSGVTLDPVRRRVHLDLAEGVPAVDGLPGWAAELVELVARPSLRLAAEVVTAGAVTTHVWATPAGAAVGEPASDGTVAVSYVEPLLIPLVLARAIGLRRQPPPPGRTPLEVPAAALSTLSAVDGGDFARLLRHRRTSWRVSSVWQDEAGRRVVDAVQGLDAGPAGQWLVRAVMSAPGAVLAFDPVSASQVWARLLGLLPRRRESVHG